MKYRVSVIEEIQAIQIFEIEAESPEGAALKADLMREPERRCDVVSLRTFNVMEPEKSRMFPQEEPVYSPYLGTDKPMAYKVLAVFEDSDLEEIE